MLPITKTQTFENECCSIELDPDIGCLIFNWKGLLPSPAFREVHQHALTLIRKHRITKILGDARRMKTIGSADSEWLLSFWMPAAIAAGFRYSAIVESDYVFNQLSINAFVEKANPDQVVFQYFKTPEQAQFWLKNC